MSDDTYDDEAQMQLLVTQVPLRDAPHVLVDWVENVFQDCLTGAGKKGEARCCANWTEHPEAVHRLAAMYDEWLVMLAGVEGAPSLHLVYREVLDYHLPYLVNWEYGVFARCDVDGHEPHRRIDHLLSPQPANSTRL